MSYKLPVIVSDIPANREVELNVDVYFKVGNIDELAIKLQSNVKKSFQRIEYDMTKYNWDNIAKQVMSIYEKMK